MLTEPQRRTLKLAARTAETGEHDGICPTGGGQRKMYARLDALGLLEYDGEGQSEMDRNGNSRQVSIYKITAAGRALLAADDQERKR